MKSSPGLIRRPLREVRGTKRVTPSSGLGDDRELDCPVLVTKAVIILQRGQERLGADRQGASGYEGGGCNQMTKI